MSDVLKNQQQVNDSNESTTTDQAQNNQNNTEEPKVKEKVDISIPDDKKLDFSALYDCKIMESVALCGLVSTMFHAAYSDFEGCDFQVPMLNQNQPNPNLIPTINLYFNHREQTPGAGQYRGVTKVIDDRTKNDVLRQIRVHDRKIQEGDRYYLTEEGKDGITPYLVDIAAIKKNNGEYNWAKIVSLVSDPASPMMGIPNVPAQYTQVRFIDPVKILKAVFGDKDENGGRLEYLLQVTRRKMTNVGYTGQIAYTNNWLLLVNRISEENLKEYVELLGLQPLAASFPMVR